MRNIFENALNVELLEPISFGLYGVLRLYLLSVETKRKDNWIPFYPASIRSARFPTRMC